MSLADPSKRGEPPPRGTGFVERARNPLKPPKPFDPLPEIVVVLEGGTPAPEDTEAPRRAVKYRLVGESFEIPLLPVVAGSEVEIKNEGRKLPSLYSPEDPELVPADPINKGGVRRFKVDKANRSIEIRDRDSAHLSGRVVAFSHSYFSRVDESGKFEIAGVPAGTWTIRIWYRNGWVEMPETTVEVQARRGARSVRVALPASLTIAGE